MSVLILIPLLATAAFLVLVAPVLFRLVQPCRVNEIAPDWLDRFNPSTYYPMRALLAHDDFRFLASQPGFDLSLYRKLRRDRMVIFRQYLRCMIGDFNRLHSLARLLIAHSQSDQSALVSRLFFLRLRFSASVLQAEISYLFCYLGFHTLAVQQTIDALEDMNRELHSIGMLHLRAAA